MGARQELKYWKFTLDQTQYGLGAGWANPGYDDSRWIQVESYTSWETYEQALFDYEGHGWFRTWVEAAPVTGKHYVLKFDGVGGVAQVYVNGKLAGGTENRYLPFDVDVTNFLKEGKNLVAVLVDNSHRGNTHLTGSNLVEWVFYGGLTHKIYLEEQPAIHIAHVRADAEHTGELKVQVTVENRRIAAFTGTAAICVAGCRQAVPVEVKGKGKQVVEFALQAQGIQPWSPDTPQLYALELELKDAGQVYDTCVQQIGFRTIAVDGTRILLNGQEILLKGANRYDEYAPYGICPPEELIREEFLKMKQCGINLIRTHYPQDDVHYRLADELGLMYMIEVPINWWNPPASNTLADHLGLAAEAVDALDRTFQNFCNHPCWTVWSVGNECAHSRTACQEMFRMLAKRMRDMNCRRLISYAANKPILDSHELDFCDFIGMNYYSGILSESVEDFPEQLTAVLERKLGTARELYPDKPHVMTEFGYNCIYGIHGSQTEGRFTEDFGATFLKEDCAEFLKDPQMKGLIIWCWADYRHRRTFVPSKTGMGFQATYGPYGLVSIDRKPKQQLLDVMTEVYNGWQV